MVGRILAAKDKSLQAAKFEGRGREVEYRIEGNPGLVLVVGAPNAAGQSTKTWRCYYSVTREGRQTIRKARIGRYGGRPPLIGLAEARREAAVLMAQVERGLDPVAIERSERVERTRKALTFADMVADYIADHRRQGHATSDDIERVLQNNAMPELGKFKPSAITPVDIQRTVDKVRDRLSTKRGIKARGEMERRVLRYIKQVYNAALLDNEVLRHKYDLTVNPAESVGRNRRNKIGRYGKAQPRKRFLSNEEIVAFWRVLEDSNADIQTQRLLKLLLVTGARSSEVRCMDISELRLDGPEPVWRLPAKRAKNRKEHLKPLSPLAVTLLKEAIGKRKRGAVLPSEESRDGFMTVKGARRAISRMIQSGRLSCPHFTPHDLRRTAGTGMANLGVPDDIIGRTLGHSKHDVTNVVYIHAGYETEKREAMDRWASHLSELIQAPAAESPVAGFEGNPAIR